MGVLQDPAIQLLLHGFFAVLFARSAVHKWRDLAAFEAAVDAYEVLPSGMAPSAARVLAVLESAVAIGLLTPVAGHWPALAGAALLLVYAGAMAVAWTRGLRDIDCGCGTPGVARPIGPDLMLRNGLLACASALAAMTAVSRPLGWLDVACVLAAGCALVLLQSALDQGLSQLRSMRAWRRPA